MFPSVIVRAVDGIMAPAENTPENRHRYAFESARTGVVAKIEGKAVAVEGAETSHGVLAEVFDPCGGVVSAAVGSRVEGKIETGGAEHTERGHERTELISILTGVDTKKTQGN